jgi:hypothetical protein
MYAGSSSTQTVPRCRGRRRRSLDVTIPHINSNTYQENRRIHRARINVAPNPNSLAIEHQPAGPSPHAQSTTADSSIGKIKNLVASLSYEFFCFVLKFQLYFSSCFFITTTIFAA